jgi:uncharacterized protein (TIGR02271 family)
VSSTGYIQGISQGDEVYGADSEKVGKVAEVQAGYIVVEKGFFFPTDYYIPTSAIASAGDGQVYLNVSKDVALQSGWDTIPAGGYTTTDTDFVAADTYATGTTATAAADTLVDATYGDRVGAVRETADEIHIPVVEEELTAVKRAQQAGAVRIEKDVIAEERVLEVPVTEERIRVERRVVDRPVSAADADILEETVIEVPLYTEDVELQKQARVAEEVVISKEAVQRTEQVRGTVRREEVIVDEDAVVDATITDETMRGRDRAI